MIPGRFEKDGFRLGAKDVLLLNVTEEFQCR
jgi:hypothetical protein